MAALDKVRNELVMLWDRLGPLWGISPSAARVHAWLIAQPEPQEAEEIAAGLGMSRGAVSMACTELAEWGVIVAERPAGSRRQLHRPVTDLEQVIRHVIQTRKQREWDPLLAQLDRWLDALESNDAAGVAEVRTRLERIRGVVGAVDRMAETFLQGGALGALGLKALVRASRSGRRR
jgi:DNA-binding transcriptional regulator GbsR (MarR family)